MRSILLYSVIYPTAAMALPLVFALMVGRRISARWLWAATGAAVIACGVRLIYLTWFAPQWGLDHRIFWSVGQDILRSLDPYAPERIEGHTFLNPPSALPLFALFAALPFRSSLAVWCLIYTAAALGGVVLARRCLTVEGSETIARLPAAELGVLTATFVLSDACMATLELGQLALLVMALVLLALLAQGSGRPALAGVLLGLATIKVNTMLPFLILFLRRSDIRAWVALIGSVALLVVLGGHSEHLLDQCRVMLGLISELSRPGGINDLSYAGPSNEWILGFDHAMYRIGLRDRSALSLFNLVLDGLLGLALSWQLLTRRIERPLGIALISLFAALFLYHRLYDTVIVAPALVYAFAGARASRGRQRVAFMVSAVAMLGLLYMRRATLAKLTDWAPGRGLPGRLVEILVLPMGTWCILIAMAGLWLGHRWRTRSAIPSATEQGASP
jgi:hypothetical protein